MQSKRLTLVVHILFILTIVIVFFPLIGILIISFSDAETVRQYGYSLIPMKWSVEAYKLVFANLFPLVKAVLLTLITGGISAGLTVLLCALMAYGMSRPNFAYKKAANIFILIPMLFNGGLIPTYILNSQILGLNDNIMIYLVTGLVTTANIILFRTFFIGIPVSMIEAARIDGASEMKTFVKIAVPMSKSIVASIFFTTLLQKWNDFETPLYYIRDKNLYNIQYFLQKIIRDATYINELYKNSAVFTGEHLPEETLPYAMAIVVCIPILIVFPYMQRFFSKGMAIGAVKE